MAMSPDDQNMLASLIRLLKDGQFKKALETLTPYEEAKRGRLGSKLKEEGRI